MNLPREALAGLAYFMPSYILPLGLIVRRTRDYFVREFQGVCIGGYVPVLSFRYVLFQYIHIYYLPSYHHTSCNLRIYTRVHVSLRLLVPHIFVSVSVCKSGLNHTKESSYSRSFLRTYLSNIKLTRWSEMELRGYESSWD